MADKQAICDAVLSGQSLSLVAVHHDISRERVRQIVMSVTGLSWRDIHPSALPRPAPMRAVEAMFFAEAPKHGITPIWCDHYFRCGDITVAALTTSMRPSGYWLIQRPVQDRDFGCWSFHDGRWLIMPFSEWPTPTTMFSTEPQANSGRGITYSRKHGFSKFINRWDLLGGDMKIQTAIPTNDIPGRRGIPSKHQPLIEKVKDLPDGLALPVECEDTREAVNVQTAIFGEQNKQSGALRGSKYSVVRRKNMLYVSRVMNGPEGK